MRVVINSCYGGFGLSHQGVMRYAEIKGIKLYPWIDDIVKKVYGDRAKIENADSVGFCVHYCTKPIKDETQYEAGKEKDEIYWSDRNLERNDPALIQLVNELKEKANGNCAKLEIIEIPDGVEYEIQEYDGAEHIAEKHRTWGT